MKLLTKNSTQIVLLALVASTLSVGTAHAWDRSGTLLMPGFTTSSTQSAEFCAVSPRGGVVVARNKSWGNFRQSIARFDLRGRVIPIGGKSWRRISSRWVPVGSFANGDILVQTIADVRSPVVARIAPNGSMRRNFGNNGTFRTSDITTVQLLDNGTIGLIGWTGATASIGILDAWGKRQIGGWKETGTNGWIGAVESIGSDRFAAAYRADDQSHPALIAFDLKGVRDMSFGIAGSVPLETIGWIREVVATDSHIYLTAQSNEELREGGDIIVDIAQLKLNGTDLRKVERVSEFPDLGFYGSDPLHLTQQLVVGGERLVYLRSESWNGARPDLDVRVWRAGSLRDLRSIFSPGAEEASKRPYFLAQESDVAPNGRAAYLCGVRAQRGPSGLAMAKRIQIKRVSLR